MSYSVDSFVHPSLALIFSSSSSFPSGVLGSFLVFRLVFLVLGSFFSFPSGVGGFRQFLVFYLVLVVFR